MIININAYILVAVIRKISSHCNTRGRKMAARRPDGKLSWMRTRHSRFLPPGIPNASLGVSGTNHITSWTTTTTMSFLQFLESKKLNRKITCFWSRTTQKNWRFREKILSHRQALKWLTKRSDNFLPDSLTKDILQPLGLIKRLVLHPPPVQSEEYRASRLPPGARSHAKTEPAFNGRRRLKEQCHHLPCG